MPRLKRDVQAVIYVRAPGGGLKLLLIERYDKPSGQFHWRLVKGTVKPGEALEEALLREIHEEVGLTRVRVVGRIGAYSFEHGGVRHEVACYLVEADPSEPVRLAPADNGRPLRAFKWAEPGEALGLLRWPEEKQMVKGAMELLNGRGNRLE